MFKKLAFFFTFCLVAKDGVKSIKFHFSTNLFLPKIIISNYRILKKMFLFLSVNFDLSFL